MKLVNINKENDLRSWLREYVGLCEGRIQVKWIEPGPYGSTVGAPDAELSNKQRTVGVELKYLVTTRKGIRWDVRPAQRRYHHMHARKGGRSALVAYIPATHKLLLVRGDHIPLRDYSSDPDSGVRGCVDANITYQLNLFNSQEDRQTILELEKKLFYDISYWSAK